MRPVACAEIRVDHALVGAHLVRGSLRDHASVVHHDHAVARAHDEVEVVLDDQERDAVALAQREDVLEQLDAQRRADAGHRLVEQQDPRLRHQRADEVEQLALPAGERAGERARVAVEPHELEQLARRAPAPRAPGGAHAARASRRAARRGGAARRASRSRARSSASARAASGTCGRARPARSGAARGRSIRLPSSSTRPDCGRRKPEMQLKSVDLPAPFGPIRPVIEPGSTSRRRAVDGAHAVERAHDVVHLEARAHSSTISSRLPRIPCGRQSTSPMITRPITISRTYARSAPPRYESGGKSRKRVPAKRNPKTSGADGHRPDAAEPAEDHDHPREERQQRLEVVRAEERELPRVEAARRRRRAPSRSRAPGACRRARSCRARRPRPRPRGSRAARDPTACGPRARRASSSTIADAQTITSIVDVLRARRRASPGPAPGSAPTVRCTAPPSPTLPSAIVPCEPPVSESSFVAT